MTYRKLLYHRGVDDQAGTYVTDYVECGICVILGTALLVVASKRRSAAATRNCSGITLGTVAILYSLAVISFLGGLTHQNLQLVSFVC